MPHPCPPLPHMGVHSGGQREPAPLPHWHPSPRLPCLGLCSTPLPPFLSGLQPRAEPVPHPPAPPSAPNLAVLPGIAPTKLTDKPLAATGQEWRSPLQEGDTDSTFPFYSLLNFCDDHLLFLISNRADTEAHREVCPAYPGVRSWRAQPAPEGPAPCPEATSLWLTSHVSRKSVSLGITMPLGSKGMSSTPGCEAEEVAIVARRGLEPRPLLSGGPHSPLSPGGHEQEGRRC